MQIIGNKNLSVTPAHNQRNMIHFVTHRPDVASSALFDNPQTGICGREFRVMGTYSDSAVERMVDEYNRIGRTHQTFICGHCVATVNRTA